MTKYSNGDLITFCYRCKRELKREPRPSWTYPHRKNTLSTQKIHGLPRNKMFKPRTRLEKQLWQPNKKQDDD